MVKEKQECELITLKDLYDALDSAFNDWDVEKHIEKLRQLLSVKRIVDFTKSDLLNYEFEIQDECTREYYKSQYYFHYFQRFYDALIKENTQEEIDNLINKITEYRNEN